MWASQSLMAAIAKCISPRHDAKFTSISLMAVALFSPAKKSKGGRNEISPIGMSRFSMPVRLVRAAHGCRVLRDWRWEMTEEVWVDLALEILGRLKDERAKNAGLTNALAAAKKDAALQRKSRPFTWRPADQAPKGMERMIGVFVDGTYAVRWCSQTQAWHEEGTGKVIKGKLLLWTRKPEVSA